MTASDQELLTWVFIALAVAALAGIFLIGRLRRGAAPAGSKRDAEPPARPRRDRVASRPVRPEIPRPPEPEKPVRPVIEGPGRPAALVLRTAAAGETVLVLQRASDREEAELEGASDIPVLEPAETASGSFGRVLERSRALAREPEDGFAGSLFAVTVPPGAEKLEGALQALWLNGKGLPMGEPEPLEETAESVLAEAGLMLARTEPGVAGLTDLLSLERAGLEAAIARMPAQRVDIWRGLAANPMAAEAAARRVTVTGEFTGLLEALRTSPDLATAEHALRKLVEIEAAVRIERIAALSGVIASGDFREGAHAASAILALPSSLPQPESVPETEGEADDEIRATLRKLARGSEALRAGLAREAGELSQAIDTRLLAVRPLERRLIRLG
ncbi:hypothetical protein [Sutterella sp.]|uniref:hypothetical protein n=1 Tax=Sutterella sp. TaxID=1981025 RepID=UPI0026E0C637|nr:hypothetical protein [Sutterella sp.]MDO5530969.1 hypothetical protein [Sutterella sp.]